MADTPEATKPSWRRRHWRLITLLLVILIPVVVLSLWAWATLGYSYSSEDRAGYVQKIAKRGWLCKTWEGELAMASMPGTMPEVFKFSVRDDDVAAQLRLNQGKRVAVAYKEHKGVPTSCFGETQYYGTGVRTVPQP